MRFFLLSKGVDFAEFARKGINLVVTRAELDYKTSLTSGDTFWIGLNLQKSGRIRFEFSQDIYRSSDDKLVLKGKIIGTSLNERGRPFVPDELDALFNN